MEKSLIAFLIALAIGAPDFQPNPREGLIIVGDSRTGDVRDAVEGRLTNDQVFFVAEDGQGFVWFVNMAEGRINDIIDRHGEIWEWTILVCLGVNDLGHVEEYKKEYVRLAGEEWADCRLYIAAVGPVVDEICLTAKNADIDAFNYQMSALENEGVPFINNTYFIEDVMSAPDGLHYDGETSEKIYRSWLQNIAMREKKAESKEKAKSGEKAESQ